MLSGWRYRATSVLGVVAFTVASVWVANHPVPQRLLTTHVPVVARLQPTVLAGETLTLVTALAVVVVAAALLPLYEPRPRRLLDTAGLAAKRVFVAGFALAAVGYFDYTYRMPRSTLALTVAVLVVALPAWFVLVRRRPDATERAIVVGDDPRQVERIIEETSIPIRRHVTPTSPYDADEDRTTAAADGGEGPFHLDGLSRLEDVLVDQDVDTAVLAFSRSDRAEFFGALDACHEHGVTAKVLAERADAVLSDDVADDHGLVEVEVEPWGWRTRLAKRAFDVAFAVAGLVALAPVMTLVAAAIKLEDRGPVLYGQRRTAEFGDTFEVYKFRSMVPDAESDSGPTISQEDAGGVDPRVTRVGRIIRATHLDELPQLWSVLVGDMSVVGPRPERPALDADIERGVGDWPRRWFVKPGLTGLAQVNGVTGADPERKLRYDTAYIRRQSFWFDLKIVVRQVWLVLVDAAELLAGRDDR